MAELTPQLSARDVDTYVAFLRDAFGFELRSDWRDPSDAGHVNIEVERDGVTIGIGRGEEPHSGLYVIVDDVDAHYEQARAAGANITFELADQPWGHRMYGVTDPEGHDWGFASPISPIDHMRRRGVRDFQTIASAMGAPIYGLTDDRPMSRRHGGFGGGRTPDGDNYHVSLRHQWPGAEIDVLTDTQVTSSRTSAASMLSDWLVRRVHLAPTIDFPVRIEVDGWSSSVPVDGVPVSFDVVGDASGWEGTAVVGERLVHLTVSGARPDEIHLATVDPHTYLSG